MSGMVKADDSGFFAWGRVRTKESYAALQDQKAGLDALDLTSASDRDVSAAIDAFGQGYLIKRMWGTPATAYRASRITDPNDPWKTLGDLWAPPAKFAVQGRFNAKNKPVLYVSTDPITALWEVRAKKDEYRTILVLKKRDPDKGILLAQFGLHMLPKTEDYRRGLGAIADGARADPALIDFLRERQTYDEWLLQDDYFTKLCTDQYDDNDAQAYYRLTNALSRQFMKIRDVVGIQYPSVARSVQGMNLVVPTNVGRAEFYPFQAWLVKITALDQGSFGTSPGVAVVATGEFDSSNAITWTPADNLDLERVHRIVSPRTRQWKGDKIVRIAPSPVGGRTKRGKTRWWRLLFSRLLNWLRR